MSDERSEHKLYGAQVLERGIGQPGLRQQQERGPCGEALSFEIPNWHVLYDFHVGFGQARIEVPFHGIKFYIDHIHDGFVRAFAFSFGDEDFIGFVA